MNTLKHQTISGIKCKVCGSADIIEKFSRRDILDILDLLYCRNCGLAFLSPEPENKTQENKYWDNTKQKEIYTDNKIEINFQRDFENKVRLLNSIKEKGRLLDIGCGTGQFLKVARKTGWDVYGLDISQEAAGIAKEKYGIRVFLGKPETFDAHGMMFDCVSLWDAIEHFKDPAASLEAISSLLVPGGVVILRTPNNNALLRKIALFLAGIGIKSFLKYVYYAPHYFYFNAKTLKKILEKAGFQVEKVLLENTDQEFAKAKIDAHYKTQDRALAKIMLPIVNFFSVILGMQNKIVLVAKKI